jgi:hypothetical protein
MCVDRKKFLSQNWKPAFGRALFTLARKHAARKRLKNSRGKSGKAGGKSGLTFFSLEGILQSGYCLA